MGRVKIIFLAIVRVFIEFVIHVASVILGKQKEKYRADWHMRVTRLEHTDKSSFDEQAYIKLYCFIKYHMLAMLFYRYWYNNINCLYWQIKLYKKLKKSQPRRWYNLDKFWTLLWLTTINKGKCQVSFANCRSRIQIIATQ